MTNARRRTKRPDAVAQAGGDEEQGHEAAIERLREIAENGLDDPALDGLDDVDPAAVAAVAGDVLEDDAQVADVGVGHVQLHLEALDLDAVLDLDRALDAGRVIVGDVLDLGVLHHDFVGIRARPAIQGESLVDLMRGGTEKGERPALSEALLYGTEKKAIRSQLRTFEPEGESCDRHLLFDHLRLDPPPVTCLAPRQGLFCLAIENVDTAGRP